MPSFSQGVPLSAALQETLALHGLDRFAARKKIVERLDAAGLLDKIEPTIHTVPHGDRSGAVLEPFLTDQWYVDAKTLAQPAITAVREGKTSFVPSQWQATFFNWMENIQPWCISRQIWWGHQIPAWYGPDGKVFVAESEDDAVADALAHYTDIEEITVEEGHDIAADPERRARFANEYLHRDEDVLDTWFSSALWPFSTLGWPDETPELKRYYPTSVLVTGFDIIFFWVARMMMMGLHFMGEVPFPTVYIHALVRDASGAKMSKSKGNVIDPLEADRRIRRRRACASRSPPWRRRAAISSSSAQRVDGYRNFATKLWNAARFAEINGCARNVEASIRSARKKRSTAGSRTRPQRPPARLRQAIEAYHFNEAASAAYRFVWNIYCDWYLELAKPLLTGADVTAKDETRAMVAWVRDEILKLLHPVHAVHHRGAVGGHSRRQWPTAIACWRSATGRDASTALDDDAKAEAEIGWVIDLITAIRSVRAEMNVPAGAQLPLVIAIGSLQTTSWSGPSAGRSSMQASSRASKFRSLIAAPRSGRCSQLVVRGEVAALPLAA